MNWPNSRAEVSHAGCCRGLAHAALLQGTFEAIRHVLSAVAALIAITAHVSSAQPAPAPGDPAFVTSTVEALGRVIRQEYFDAALAAKVDASLRSAIAEGRYVSTASPEALAQVLTNDLYAVTHDKHLAVAVRRPESAASAGGGGVMQRDQPTTAGFRRVEVLAGNIGYLDLTMFLRPAEHRDALAAAMETLRHADALILDMRENGGGSPGTVALLMSYLLAAPGLPLFEVVSRSGDIARYATEPASANIERDGERPIWVLTSARTFSGGEGLAFLLQERGRAQVIGEKTAGAANPGRPYVVNDVFEVTVPNGYVRSAVRRANWEGDGVTPDVTVPAATALDTALERARQALRNRRDP